MRKVRYLASIAGLAVALTGAAVPAAYADSAPTALLVRAQPANPGSASTSDCTGKIEAHADHNHEALTFWYRKDGCIGTVKTTTYTAAAGKCANPQLRIYGDGKLVYKNYYGSPGAKIFVCSPLNVTIYWGVHTRYANPVEVRATAEIPESEGGGILGPAVVTVNK
jgi:hypothetical protein